MSNSNGIPDIASEIQALMGHVQSPCILSTTWPIVPVSSLTLAAFATHGFVKDGTQLVYVNQAAAPVTLSGADGAYWVAIHRNTSAAVASWARQPGTHYLWRTNPTKPAEPAGGLILAQVTIAGGVISAVSTLATPQVPLSSLASTGQSVTIPSAVFSKGAAVLDYAGDNISAFFTTLQATGGTGRFAVNASGTAPSHFTGNVDITGRLGITGPANAGVAIQVQHDKATFHGIKVQPTGSDAAGTSAMLFTNVADTVVGSIVGSATATAYNTSSDARLKELIEDLPNPLQVIAGLRPILFRWRRNGDVGRGFLAHEVQALVPEAVTGEQNAVDPEGAIIPQQIDHSKLVPHLVGAVKALIALNVVRTNQLQALAARVAALEALP